MPIYTYTEAAPGLGYLNLISEDLQNVQVVHFDNPSNENLSHIETVLKVKFTSYDHSTKTANFE